MRSELLLRLRLALGAAVRGAALGSGAAAVLVAAAPEVVAGQLLAAGAVEALDEVGHRAGLVISMPKVTDASYGPTPSLSRNVSINPSPSLPSGSCNTRDGRSRAATDVQPRAAAEWRHNDADARSMAERYDLNQDGEITQEEIHSNRAEWHAEFSGDDDAMTLEQFQDLWLRARHRQMVHEFQRIDRDGDGRITLVEYQLAADIAGVEFRTPA